MWVIDDGQVSVADISAMMAALADLAGYETSHGLSDSQLLAIADLNGDSHVTNADIQGLINYLAGGRGGGSGSVAAIPEPSGLILLALGGLPVAAMPFRRSLRRR